MQTTHGAPRPEVDQNRVLGPSSRGGDRQEALYIQGKCIILYSNTALTVEE